MAIPPVENSSAVASKRKRLWVVRLMSESPKYRTRQSRMGERPARDRNRLPPTKLRPPIPHLRWWIGGLLFASTVINYIDRQTLSVLAPI